MKKFFTLVMALVAVMTMNATVVTLSVSDFTAVNPAAAIDQTVKGVRVQITNGLINSSEVRIYKNSTITITAEAAMSAVVFHCTASDAAQYGPGCFGALDGYSYKGMTGTWLGNAATLALTASSAQVRATSIDIYTDGEVPAEDTWVADTVSVSQAVALAAANDNHDHFVKGVVMDAPFITYETFGGKVSFWMSDVENPTDTIEFYDGYAGPDAAKWASLELAQETLHQGDTILVYAGLLKPYTKGENTIYEVTAGYYAEMLGANPDAPQVEYEPITVAEALAIAQALAPELGKSLATPDTYAVQGFVVGISTTKENTFYLADVAGAYGEFQAYQCASVDRTVVEGDFVMVIGKISHYYGSNDKGEYHNYEIAKGILKHVWGEGIENVTLTEQAQKVMIDGVMYIVRDGKMFNVQGVQVR